MRLVCTVAIGNRLLPTLAVRSDRKHVKSTLALCKQPKSAVYCVILFTAQNKTGTKYELKENIRQVLTRFVNEGKATIQFKQPPHDLYVQADTIQLKSFLHLLRRALENKMSERELTCSSMSVTAVSSKNIPPKKLTIQSRADYPLQGFPRTVEVLHINDIQRSSLDLGILRLTKLRILDLSNNCIEFLPAEMGKLPNLREMNLSHNRLGRSSPKRWNWIGGTLTGSLKLLNLSHNELTFLPDGIVQLHNLITLNVDGNELKLLPSGIGNLTNLRVLTASNNRLSSLPGSVKKWQLENLDIFNNGFDPHYRSPAAIFPKVLPLCSLKEYAARKVLSARLRYSSEILPVTVLHYLDLARYCICGKACFDVFIQHPHVLLLTSIAHTYSSDGLYYVPIDCYFCSVKCFGTSNYNRGRIPVT